MRSRRDRRKLTATHNYFNTYGLLGLSGTSPMWHSENFRKGFIDMCVALGDSRIEAGVRFHAFLHGFYYEFGGDNVWANEKRG